MNSLTERMVTITKNIYSSMIISEECFYKNLMTLLMTTIFKTLIVYFIDGFLVNSFKMYFFEKLLIISMIPIVFIYTVEKDRNSIQNNIKRNIDSNLDENKRTVTNFGLCYFLPLMIIFILIPFEIYFLIIPMVEITNHLLNKTLGKKIELFYDFYFTNLNFKIDEIFKITFFVCFQIYSCTKYFNNLYINEKIFFTEYIIYMIISLIDIFNFYAIKLKIDRFLEKESLNKSNDNSENFKNNLENVRNDYVISSSNLEIVNNSPIILNGIDQIDNNISDSFPNNNQFTISIFNHEYLNERVNNITCPFDESHIEVEILSNKLNKSNINDNCFISKLEILNLNRNDSSSFNNKFNSTSKKNNTVNFKSKSVNFNSKRSSYKDQLSVENSSLSKKFENSDSNIFSFKNVYHLTESRKSSSKNNVHCIDENKLIFSKEIFNSLTKPIIVANITQEEIIFINDKFKNEPFLTKLLNSQKGFKEVNNISSNSNLNSSKNVHKYNKNTMNYSLDDILNMCNSLYRNIQTNEKNNNEELEISLLKDITNMTGIKRNNISKIRKKTSSKDVKLKKMFTFSKNLALYSSNKNINENNAISANRKIF